MFHVVSLVACFSELSQSMVCPTGSWSCTSSHLLWSWCQCTHWGSTWLQVGIHIHMYCILCKFENFISYCFVHHFTVFWVSWAIIAMVEVCVIIRKPLPVIESLEKNRNMFCIFYFFYYHSSRENQRYYSLHSFSLLFIIISYSFITDQFCTMLYYQAQCLLSTSF